MNFINKIMSTHYSLPTFVWVVVSLIIAAVVAQIAYTGTPNPFVDSLPFDGNVWSSVLILSSAATIVGMVKDTKSKWFVRTGSFFSFCLWIFGTISFALSGSAVLIPILSAPLLLVFAYIYLASLDRHQQL